MSGGRRRRWAPILAAAATASLVAAVGATMTDLGPWYQSLRKPAWQPPDWLFGPAWTIIFGLTATAFVKAWRSARSGRRADWIIVLFSVNGVLNILWSALFFRVKRPDWAFVEVLFLWASIVLLIIVVGRDSRPAAALLLPYLAWVTFAAALNLSVARLNGAL